MAPLLRLGPTKLILPGQVKPTGIPKLDWSHPLTFGMLVYVFDPGDGPALDLVSGQVGVFGSNSTTLATRGASRFGTANHYNGGQSYSFVFNNLVAAATSVGTVASAGYTENTANAATGYFEWDVYSNTLGGTQTGYRDCEYHSNAPGSSGLSCYGGLNGTNAVFYVPSTTVNDFVFFAITSDGANRNGYGATSLNADQPLRNFGTAAETNKVIDAVCHLAIGDYTVVPIGGAAPNFPYTGSVFFWALWNRVLSLNEIIQLNLDPYQFLTFPQHSAFEVLNVPTLPPQVILNPGRSKLINV